MSLIQTGVYPDGSPIWIDTTTGKAPVGTSGYVDPKTYGTTQVNIARPPPPPPAPTQSAFQVWANTLGDSIGAFVTGGGIQADVGAIGSAVGAAVTGNFSKAAQSLGTIVQTAQTAAGTGETQALKDAGLSDAQIKGIVSQQGFLGNFLSPAGGSSSSSSDPAQLAARRHRHLLVLELGGVLILGAVVWMLSRK